MWTSGYRPLTSKQGFVGVGYGLVAIGVGFSYLKSLFSRTPDQPSQFQPPQELSMLPGSTDDSVCLCVFAGESLTNPEVDHIHVVLNPSAFLGIYAGDPMAWSFLLYIIGQEIAT